MGARATHDPGTATLCSRTDDFSVNLAASVFGRSPSGLVAITDLFFEEDTDDFGTPAQSVTNGRAYDRPDADDLHAPDALAEHKQADQRRHSRLETGRRWKPSQRVVLQSVGDDLAEHGDAQPGQQ